MNLVRFFVLVFMMISVNNLYSQSKETQEVVAETSKLKKAVETKNESAEAESYYNIGETFFNDRNFSKSEEYFIKSKNIYEKLNDKQNLEKVIRKLAQSQENQNKLKSAQSNYQKASKIGYSKSKRNLNANDASRLSSPAPENKAEAIQSNIQISEKENNKQDLAASYSQMADVNIENKNIPKAEENLNTAYQISKEQAPQQALAINQKLTNFYVDNKDFDKAIEAKKSVLKENFVKENSQKKVEQIQELAEIYIKKNDPKEAIVLLKNAYDIALQKGHTLEAQKSVKKLDSLYNISENTDASVLLYRDFLGKLPDLVSKDRSLVDNKILEDTEQKISQLLQEKKLKDELIRKKNIFNYSLIGVLVLLTGLIIFIFRTLKKVQIKNKKIALQSLRREMNPHFIFNSLNSVNHFIATNNELEANQYLTKFSKLMRGVMENSSEDFIPFQQELDLLQNYLALEKTRFADKFDYEIEVDESLNTQNLKVPGMLIQPFLENAVWHGLRYRTDKGFLSLKFTKNNDFLKITIKDNGIGIEESKKQKTEHQKTREGRGMKNTLERIKLLNDLYKKNIICTVKDSENGVFVEVSMII
ncbi:histidine kinase [Chryseobacterium indoltheticum]|uniref:Histidine kinase n=1 Tax=Chryseobacterium indoltheticum TaxID=254 RepID=A0A381FB84_9FLAO|nr:histidine kinase [Chryseobacterium indoltheticum]AZA73471.1 histidine kinase [Chryseobacterium indoltheticum]SIR01486.1 Histidine kinase [Chryseobacterium indoltheticum]SUX43332.1 Inner membrane protein ypdA [Chryseobacterium indoltheticum]